MISQKLQIIINLLQVNKHFTISALPGIVENSVVGTLPFYFASLCNKLGHYSQFFLKLQIG